MDDPTLAPPAEKAPVTAPATAAPGASPQTPPHDELFPETPAPAENPSLERVRAASGGVFSRFSQWIKPGRGRPRKDGQPKKSDVLYPAGPAGLAPGENGGPAGAGGPDNAAVVRAALERVGRAAASFFDRLLLNRAVFATEDENFAAKLVKETTATDVEIAAFADLGEIALRELKLQTKFIPVIAAGTVVAVAGLRYGVAIKSVNALVKKKQDGQITRLEQRAGNLEEIAKSLH